MLNTFKDMLNNAKTTIANEITKFQSRDFMEAVVAGCTMVAAANGEFKSEEKQKMLNALKMNDSLKVFDQSDVIKVFNGFSEKFEFDIGIGNAEALSTISKMAGKDGADLIVSVCCAIGAADGDFDADEKSCVIDICNALKLSPARYGL